MLSKVVDIHAHVGSSAALYVGGSIQVVTSRMEKHGIHIPLFHPFPVLKTPMAWNPSTK